MHFFLLRRKLFERRKILHFSLYYLLCLTLYLFWVWRQVHSDPGWREVGQGGAAHGGSRDHEGLITHGGGSTSWAKGLPRKGKTEGIGDKKGGRGAMVKVEGGNRESHKKDDG